MESMAEMASSAVSGWRIRLFHALVAALVGLAVRYGLDGFAAKYLGVGLWASTLYFLILALRPELMARTACLVATAGGMIVECLQLTPLPAKFSALALPLAWIFGSVFSLYDLPAYAAGAILAAVIDARFLRK